MIGSVAAGELYSDSMTINLTNRLRCQGFSSSDLLVVIVIGVLMAGALLVGVPAWNGSRTQARQALAQSNLRQLTAGWTQYAADNQDALPAAGTGIIGGLESGFNGSACQYLSRSIPTWAGPAAYNQDGWLGDGKFQNGQVDPACSIYFSPLWKYVDGKAEVFRDPADPSRLVRPGGSSEPRPRVRSFSMNQWMGGPGSAAGNIPGPIRKLSDIPPPSRADKVVLLGESPDTLDDGFFAVPASDEPAAEASSRPATYHRGAGPVSFSDGHSEMVQWAVPDENDPELLVPDPLTADWLQQHAVTW